MTSRSGSGHLVVILPSQPACSSPSGSRWYSCSARALAPHTAPEKYAYYAYYHTCPARCSVAAGPTSRKTAGLKVVFDTTVSSTGGRLGSATEPGTPTVNMKGAPICGENPRHGLVFAGKCDKCIRERAAASRHARRCQRCNRLATRAGVCVGRCSGEQDGRAGTDDDDSPESGSVTEVRLTPRLRELSLRALEATFSGLVYVASVCSAMGFGLLGFKRDGAKVIYGCGMLKKMCEGFKENHPGAFVEMAKVTTHTRAGVFERSSAPWVLLHTEADFTWTGVWIVLTFPGMWLCSLKHAAHLASLHHAPSPRAHHPVVTRLGTRS